MVEHDREVLQLHRYGAGVGSHAGALHDVGVVPRDPGRLEVVGGRRRPCTSPATWICSWLSRRRG